ncbi:hypothetical protein ACHQM5_008385 [Ranunculus cassubicifolius]
MEEYLTFPILLCNKDFPEMRNGAHYLIFKDFNRPMMYYDNKTEIETVRKGKYLFYLHLVRLSMVIMM